jgi:Beta-galactosidase
MQFATNPARRDAEKVRAERLPSHDPDRPVKIAPLALLAGAAAAVCPSVVWAYEPPPSDFFPVGVFLQPVTTFDTWKARGVNTVVDFAASSQPLETWNAAAVARGLYMIRAPRANPAQDVNEKNLLAWSQPDEPDYKNIPASTLGAAYATMKKADPTRPVFANFAGTMVLNPYDSVNQAQYQQYMQAADWVGNDIYPITAWNHPEWIDFSKPLKQNDPYSIGSRMNPGVTVDTLRNWSGGKRQFAYIETSWQDLNSPAAAARGVTPDQLRGEVWDAIIHGAKGIIYFPQRVGATVFMDDNTPADVAAEITRQDALIKSLGGVLNAGNDAMDNRVAFNNPDLEGTWRDLNGKRYLFVLNMSSQTLTGINFTTAGLSSLNQLQVYNELRSEILSGGVINDSFAPYQLHVYTTDPSAGPQVVSGGIPVPEPAGGALVLGAASAGLLKRRRRAA